MVSYFNRVFGHLFPGQIAKSEDIHDIQTNIQDALASLNSDHHDHESYILGGQEDAFLLTPSGKTLGRYLDTYSVPTDGELIGLSLREYTYRQPIAKTKSNTYSVILKMGNKTSEDVPVTCELQDLDGNILRSFTHTLYSNTDKREYEFIFDLKEQPTAMGLDFYDLVLEGGDQIPPRHKFEYPIEGVSHRGEEDIKNFSMGTNQLYLVVKPIGLQIFENKSNEFIDTLDDESFVIYADKGGIYGGIFDCFLEQGKVGSFELTEYSLYFKDVFSNQINYSCKGGQAIIAGEKVICLDTHVDVYGGSQYGNVLSLIYMDTSGHLHSCNSKASNIRSTELEDWEMEEILPPAHLLIGKVLIYANQNKEPLLIQDDNTQETRPRSHHERLRRLEKQMDYQEDITIPPRLKYTLSGDSWLDVNGDFGLLAEIYKDNATENDPDGSVGYLTLDGDGNLIVTTTQHQSSKGIINFKKTEEELKEYVDADATLRKWADALDNISDG